MTRATRIEILGHEGEVLRTVDVRHESYGLTTKVEGIVRNFWMARGEPMPKELARTVGPVGLVGGAPMDWAERESGKVLGKFRE